MYERDLNDRTDVTVVWEPDDSELGKEAVGLVADETRTSLDSDSFPARLPGTFSEQKKLAGKIRNKYQKLHAEKYGSESKYS